MRSKGGDRFRDVGGGLHFDPYRADRDHAAVERAAAAKEDRKHRWLVSPMADPFIRRRQQVAQTMTRRAKSRPVSLAKVWGRHGEETVR
jgi:hypothetical protein